MSRVNMVAMGLSHPRQDRAQICIAGRDLGRDGITGSSSGALQGAAKCRNNIHLAALQYHGSVQWRIQRCHGHASTLACRRRQFNHAGRFQDHHSETANPEGGTHRGDDGEAGDHAA